MGEMADYLTEQGMDQLAMHDAGMCDGPCQECEADEQDEIERLQSLVIELADCLREVHDFCGPPRSYRDASRHEAAMKNAIRLMKLVGG